MTSNFLNALSNNGNLAFTTNGAVSNSTTGSSVLDLYSKLGALRHQQESTIVSAFIKAFLEDEVLTLKCLFHARDIRGGLGERRLFRIGAKALLPLVVANEQNKIKTGVTKLSLFVDGDEYIKKLLREIPEMGRWDDLIVMAELPELRKHVIEIVQAMLILDSYADNKPSLLAKWMPSENSGLTRSKAQKRIEARLASGNYPRGYTKEDLEKLLEETKQSTTFKSKSRNQALKWQGYLQMTPKEYRKMLSAIRAKIKVVEQDMCSGNWGNIDYEKIPSRAGLVYRNAFKRNDEERYTSYLEGLKSGEKKVNSSTLYPYDVISSVMTNYGSLQYDEDLVSLYNAMWEQMADCTSVDFGDTLAIVDTSGSMENYDAVPLKVALSMGMYLSENNKGAYKNKLLYFSDHCDVVELRGTGFVERLENLVRDTKDWSGSTNIELVFDKMLQSAILYNLAPSDLPKRVVIFSDLEFNRMMTTNTELGWREKDKLEGNLKTLFDNLRTRWNQHGYDLPSVVFWNVNAVNKQYPIRKNEAGMQLVSGYSVNTLLALTSGKEVLTAYDLMLDVLGNERYDFIK